MPNTIVADIVASNLQITLNCHELGITVKSKCSSAAMCREIMDKYPQYSEYSLVCRRDGRDAFTITNIGRMSGKKVIEEETGLHIVKYRVFESGKF